MTTPPSVELLYFNIRGRAEQIRLLLEFARTQYTDTAVTREQWPELKKTLPLGQLPILIKRSHAGTVYIPQSVAIMRHLARVEDLYGADERQRTMADFLADTLVDWRSAFNRVAFGPGRGDREVLNKYVAETAPTSRILFERLLEQSSAPEAGLFVGPVMTYADLMIFDTIDTHLDIEPTFLDTTPGLRRFVEKVRSVPSIADYLKRRRPSDFAQPSSSEPSKSS